ncbi:MAG: protein kinase [Thermoanaerobaculia bacterium]
MIDTTVGRYLVLSRLGGGGMGVVYEAKDQVLGRRVALKFLAEPLARESAALERFAREARAASALNHPSLCTLFEIGEHQGSPYLVMERLEGESLETVLARGALPLPRLLELAIEIADGLDAAHRAGIVHRDLKPGNLFVTGLGHAKILDFGLAKLLAPDSDGGSQTPTQAGALTATGATLGTVPYMSPEQARGEPIDARSDLFSFGAVLYEMASGRRAFQGANPLAALDAVLRSEPPALALSAPGAPPELQRILAKALEKDRELRYQGAAELRSDLKRLQRELLQASAPAAAESGTDRAAKVTAAPAASARRGRRRMALAVATALALAIAGAWVALRLRAAGAPAGNGARAIAVLAFEDAGADRADAYLRLALPDEVTDALSRSRALIIRPFNPDRAETAADPRAAGRALHAGTLVTGHFAREAGRLRVSLQAIDAQADRVLWHDTLAVDAGDLVGLRDRISERVRVGLLPALGDASGPVARGPANETAYRMYLRTLPVGRDPAPNREAIVDLERAAALDPGFAPTWAELARRRYYSYRFAKGGPSELARAEEAGRRALEIDPELTRAAGLLVTLRTERGQVAEAYDLAVALLERHPEDGQAHLTMAYVLRYGGAVEESAAECERARDLDPGLAGFGACALTFERLGRFERAREFLHLEIRSNFVSVTEVLIALRRGDLESARAIARGLPPDPEISMRSAVRALVDPPESRRAAPALAVPQIAERDCEGAYEIGALLAYEGEESQALAFLEFAIERGYCADGALATDPLLASVRQAPQFSALRARAAACRQAFDAHRARSG